MEEIWKDIPEAPGYRVSSIGRVSGKRGSPSFGSPDKNGYRIFTAQVNGSPKGLKVHRCVVSAFKDLPSGLVVNHINGVKDDNRVENLEACTHSENLLHRHRVLGISWSGKPRAYGERAAKAKIKAEDVVAIRKRYKNGERIVDIAMDYPIGQKSVSLIVHRINWKQVVP